MTHFRILVKIDANRLEYHCVADAVEEMITPFFVEGACCRPEFLKFVVTEDEDLKKFVDDTMDAVRYPDGSLKHEYDECFRNVAYQVGYDVPKYIYPEECTHCRITFAEFYGDFETFEMKWLANEKNKQTGEWGYWHNPQGYIDYYMIEETGNLPRIESADSENHVDPDEEYHPHIDGIKVGDIDFGTMEREIDIEARKWWRQYQNVKSGRQEDAPIFGIHYDLCRMGIRTVSNRGEFEASRKEFPHDQDKWVKPEWCDGPLNFKILSTIHRTYFTYNTYAVIEKDGTWHAPGRMGIFAEGDETNEAAAEWRSSFMERFLLNEDEDTVVVALDCHI